MSFNTPSDNDQPTQAENEPNQFEATPTAGPEAPGPTQEQPSDGGETAPAEHPAEQLSAEQPPSEQPPVGGGKPPFERRQGDRRQGAQQPPADAGPGPQDNSVDVLIREMSQPQQPVEVSYQPGDQAQQPAAGPKSALSLSPGMKKLLTLMAAAMVFGVAGYLIAPRQAGSATVQVSELTAVQTRLLAVQLAEKKLRSQLSAVEAQLAQAQEQATASAAAEQDARTKVTVAEKFIAKLSGELETANTANEPMRKQVAAAQKLASESQAQAKQTAAKVDGLQRELASATKQRDKYAAAKKQLQADKAAIESTLTAQQKTGTELLRLLDALELGEPPAEAPAGKKGSPAASLPEMPITIGELTCSMGQPKLTVQAGNELNLHWGQEHSAGTVNGVAASIDGKPATRAMLAAAATVATPAVAEQPGPWRVGKDSTVYYADLVAMFGKPESLAGTGRAFTAWWTIGAWARQASAEVADGIVTEFDGRRPDPSRICALAYHRAEAYRPDTSAPWTAKVKANITNAKVCYDYIAETLLPEKLREQAESQARDGLKLTAWSLAPFDSVGVWIAPTNTPSGSITIRAAVDCTWTAMDGTVNSQRRYLATTLVREQGIIRPTACAVFDPRD